MRRLLLVSIAVLVIVTLRAQQFSRVKISLDQSLSLEKLARLGLDVEHGKLQPGKYFIGEFGQQEIAKIVAEGFRTEVLIPDLATYWQQMEQPNGQEKVLPPCPPLTQTFYETPSHYQFGSMGGYVTSQELIDQLDEMALLYPNLIKARQPITTAYSTHEGRPLYWLKISDNPNEDETEPEVLYDALHHAREPNSLSQLLFYMWYLLENYDSNPEIKYLVDNTEMYFVPCVNPDGYFYNELTNPNGFGFWRKNRRDNGDGSFGVDLNRNYGYKWGFNDSGSSPDTNSEVYRGTGPFSEPETQMMRDFCLAHHFELALNYHTFGNLLIYPWGYVDGASPDHPTFSTFGPFLTRENEFLTGFGTQTVGYTTNGSSDDWMYGEQVTKPKILSMTPEVGPDTYGFWPPSSAIDDLNKSNMTMNLTLAHLVQNFGVLTPGGEKYVNELQGEILFSLKKMGLAPGQLTVSLEAVSDNIASVGNPQNFNLAHLDEAVSSTVFTLNPSLQEGDLIQFNLVLDNGLYQWREPIERIYTTYGQTVLLDAADDMANWHANDWTVTSEQFHSSPTSFTDSPDVPYSPNYFNEIELINPIRIGNANTVMLSFWAKWDIEEDEDYAQFLGDFNGIGYQPLCGKYTEAGTDQQTFMEPVYDGLQQEWVKEEFDLTQWLAFGDSVDFQFKFLMVSDEFIEADGFYFDDFELNIVSNGNTSSTYHLAKSDFKISSRPNPASDHVVIELKGTSLPNDPMVLEVVNGLGQIVASQGVQGRVFKLDTANWQPGLYQYRLQVGDRWQPAGRFLLLK